MCISQKEINLLSINGDIFLEERCEWLKLSAIFELVAIFLLNMIDKPTQNKTNFKSILDLYRQAIKNVPLLKYSWVLIATICILTITAYFKLKNSDVFYYGIGVLVISFLGFVFSFLTRTKDIVVRISLYILVYCIIGTLGAVAVSFGVFIFKGKPEFYERYFPIQSDKEITGFNLPDYSKHIYLFDTSFLHPVLRERINQLIEKSKSEGIRLFYFETYRPPQNQHEMFTIGRRGNTEETVITHADAWASLKQYGLAVTLATFKNGNWELTPDDIIKNKIDNLAYGLGIVPDKFAGTGFLFVLPNVNIDSLKQGKFPSGGDASWIQNINMNIVSWGSKLPKAPPEIQK